MSASLSLLQCVFFESSLLPSFVIVLRGILFLLGFVSIRSTSSRLDVLLRGASRLSLAVFEVPIRAFSFLSVCFAILIISCFCALIIEFLAQFGVFRFF